MKLNLIKKMMASFIIIGIHSPAAKAQCHNCTDPAPYTGQQVCGLQAPTLNSSASSCLSSSACSGSTYSYTITFPSPVKAYKIFIAGGNVISRYISGGFPNVYLEYPCSPVPKTDPEAFSEAGGNVISSVQLNLRWTNNSTNYIEVYGYTGLPNTMTASVAYYKCFTIAAPGSIPATPATVGLSSPVCSTTPKGWLLGNQGSSGATSYVWSGAVSGTFPSVTGPFIAANQTATVCVAARNACGTSAPRCATIYIPNICGGGFGKQLQGDGEITALDKSNFTADVNVYPNPASSILSVFIKQPGRYSVKITTITGQVLQTVSINGQQKLDIDINKFAKGVCIVSINENGIIIERRKILIQ